MNPASITVAVAKFSLAIGITAFLLIVAFAMPTISSVGKAAALVALGGFAITLIAGVIQSLRPVMTLELGEVHPD